MKQVIQSVTKTVKALPVMQERAKMPPERVKTQLRTFFVALVCFGISAAIFACTPAPWYVGVAFAGIGLRALDERLVKDSLKGIAQLARAVRGDSHDS